MSKKHAVNISHEITYEKKPIIQRCTFEVIQGDQKWTTLYITRYQRWQQNGLENGKWWNKTSILIAILIHSLVQTRKLCKRVNTGVRPVVWKRTFMEFYGISSPSCASLSRDDLRDTANRGKVVSLNDEKEKKTTRLLLVLLSRLCKCSFTRDVHATERKLLEERIHCGSLFAICDKY